MSSRTMFALFVLIMALAMMNVAVYAQDTTGEVTEDIPMTNSGFEEPLVDGTPPGWKTGWTWANAQSFAGKDEYAVSDQYALDGPYSIRMDGSKTEGKPTIILSEPVPAAPGLVYTASVNVYAAEAIAPHPYIMLAFFNASGRRIDYESERSSGLAGEWERVSVSGTAPEGTVSAALIIVGNTTYRGVTYWDSATMEVTYPKGMTYLPGVATSKWAEPMRVLDAEAGRVDEAYVTWWGYDPEDSTEYLQAAINSGVARVIVPNMGQDWIVRPINLRSNLELIFEEGVVVTAKKGEFKGRNDSLFTGRDIENLVMRGYGATLRMQKEDYDNPELYDKAEWRMGIALRGVTNVEISGLTIKDTGGDGIYLGRGSKTYNENVVIRDLIADNNYRQGISVISAKDLLIEDSVFRNTGGTAPMAGIDLEPNRPDERMENVVIRNSVFENNQGPGIHMYLKYMDSTSVPVSILWENLIIRGSTVGVNFNFGDSDDFPEGEIVVRNCIVEGSERNGIGIRNKNDGGSLQIKIEDCIVRDVAMSPVLNMENLQASVPVYLGANTNLHGVTLNNVTVVDSRPRPAFLGELLRVDDEGDVDDQDGFYGIRGQLKVLNPYGSELTWKGPMRDVDLNVEELESLRIDYAQAASHPEYDLEPIDVELQPVIRFVNPVPLRPYTVVRGTLIPEIELLHFDLDDVKSIEVFVDDEPVYRTSTPSVTGAFEIDTRQLGDGLHQIKVVVEGETSGRVEQVGIFEARNFELLFDRFEGPREVAWFGTVYTPVVVDQSDGWEYVTDASSSFFGDTSRKRRKGNTTEYLVWKTPNLWDFTIEVYAKDAGLDGFRDVVLVETSSDQETWQAVSYAVREMGTSAAGITKLVISGGEEQLQIAGNDHRFVRLILKESDIARDIQLGDATFRLLRN